VFDIGGTLQHKWLDHNPCTSPGPRDAIQTCQQLNFTIAINTYELAKDAQWNKAKLEQSVGLPSSVANNPRLWTTQADADQGKSKIINMQHIQQYVNTSSDCMLLFDDEVVNLQAVASAGFQTQRAWAAGNTSECHMLSDAEVKAGIAKLQGCKANQ